jgi:hypothetical protein
MAIRALAKLAQQTNLPIDPKSWQNGTYTEHHEKE